HKMYAENLGWELDSQDLRDAFAEQPGLLGARVVYEKDNGRSRGFGFVTFETAEDLQAALKAMNGVEVQDWPLRLNLAAERKPSSPPPVIEESTASNVYHTFSNLNIMHWKIQVIWSSCLHLIIIFHFKI
ncbi:RNA-binding protein cp33, partial [Lathyrus oleraceus]